MNSHAHVHTYPHMTMRIRMRTHTWSSFKETEHWSGGLSLQILSSEELLRRAPFLTVLEREREREGEKEGDSERERAWYPRAGAVCRAVVAHRIILQVRPAHHTVILESLQCRAFYPRPRRPHVAFRPRISSAHPGADDDPFIVLTETKFSHHPRPASIRPPTLPPLRGWTPTRNS